MQKLHGNDVLGLCLSRQLHLEYDPARIKTIARRVEHGEWNRLPEPARARLTKMQIDELLNVLYATRLIAGHRLPGETYSPAFPNERVDHRQASAAQP